MATFGYWQIRGLGHPIRLLLAYLGVKHTEKQYSDPEEWFGKDKLNLGLDFANLPYYIDENIKITESAAIPVYLIKKNNRHELLGQNADGSYSEREVRVQQVQGVIRDLFKESLPLLFNPEFKNIKDTAFTEKLSPILNKLVTYLGEKNFLVGELSYPDFLFYEILNYFTHIYPTSITHTLTAYIQRFENLHGVKEYLANPSVNLKVFLPPNKAVWSGPE